MSTLGPDQHTAAETSQTPADDVIESWTIADVRTRFGSIDMATITTIDERGTLSSRPMKLQLLDSSGDLWFVANNTAAWVAGSHGAPVNIAVQDERGWASFAGRIELLRNAETVSRFYDPAKSRIERTDAAVLRCATAEIEWWIQPTATEELLSDLVEFFMGEELTTSTHGRLLLDQTAAN